MPEWAVPTLLVLLPAVPLLRWLHRRRDAAATTPVSAVFLWPDVPPDPAAARRLRRVDPRWRLRALACAALVVAAAGPLLARSGLRRVDVHLDDARSLRAIEREGPRWDVARRAVADALAEARVGDVRVVPFAGPALGDPLAASAWRAAVAAAASRALPPPAALDPGREHWLVTDGADPAVVEWARAAAVDRVIRVGAATENAAPSRLAVRPDARDPERLAGLVRVTNAGTAPTTRRLVVAGTRGAVLDEPVVVPPGDAVERTFELGGAEGSLRASLVPADAVPDDDALALDLAPAAQARVRIDPGCGPRLRAALAVHPGLAVVSDRPALTVSCAEVRPVAAGPLLWFHRGTGPPHVAQSGATVDVAGDVESGEWTRHAEYPAFVADVVDRALGRAQLDRIAAVDVPDATLRIAPHPVPETPGRTPVPASRGARDVAGVAIAVAILLLALDARGARTAREVGVRLAVVALLGVALTDPALPYGRAALDVVALVDDSLSVDRAAVAARWRELAAAVATLPADGRLTVARFAAAPAVEAEGVPVGASLGSEPPRAQPLDRTRTDVERALADALRRVRRDRPTVVALVTDGAETDGDAVRALSALAAARVPVVALPVAPARAADDVWIEAIQAPTRAHTGDVADVTVVAGGNVSGDAVLRVKRDGVDVAAQTVALEAGTAARIRIPIPVGDAGPRLVRAEIARPGDPRPENDARETIVDVDGPPDVLWVGARDAPLPLAESLAAAGWRVTRARPDELEARHDTVPGLVVLDDVSAGDAAEGAWRRLDALVRREGTGLLVLGGPGSFGAGEYRGSLLEDLLPVTAEGQDTGGRAAILFVVDTSGSMEEDRDGRRRLELARRALADTLAAVPEGDLVGVTSFALEPREVLPLGRHAERERNGLALPAASGGTRLAPALADAAHRLAAANVEQRLLVLVTDGFAPEEDMAPVERAIGDAGIEVLALAVGSDVNLGPLERLGTVLRVDRTAALPRLLRRALGERRAPAAIGDSFPRVVAPPPFAPDVADWPRLGGYMVSRARPSAEVWLESERGDPLLASQRVGAGRVAVLPGGLGAWAAAWPAWNGWPRFAGGLAGWLARPAGNPRVHLRVDDASRGLAFQVDALAADGAWSSAEVAHVTARDDAGAVLETDAPARAPGRFAGSLPAILPGPYAVTVRVGDEVAVRHALRTGERELRPPDGDGDRIRAWQAAGLVEGWPERGIPRAFGGAPVPRPLRRALVLLALGVYVAVIAGEERGRAPVPRAAAA